MSVSRQIATHIRQVYGGGNWTSVNLKDTLADVDWQKATTKTGSFHTIAELVFHINYFVSAVLEVLQGRPLDAHDSLSFDCPVIQSEADWQQLLNKALTDAASFATLVEALPDNQLTEVFSQEKYGNYYRNFHGIIEHTHYHLGQIVIIKKLLNEQPD